MATALIMPKQGQSVETCTIVSWKKNVGDTVRLGEIICEVETDKATFEVESPAEGTVLAIFHPSGAQVPVLAPIAAIGKPGEDVEEIRRQAGGDAGQPPAADQARAPASAAPAAAARSRPPSATAAVSPRARALAAARGVDLTGLAGSGPGGRIIERDVLAALEGREPLSPAAREKAAGLAAGAAVPASGSGIGGRVMAADIAAAAPAATPAAAPVGAVTEIPVKGVRKLIAERMHASLATTAQLTMDSSADARALQDLRRSFKDSPEQWGLGAVTINDLVHFAVVRTLLANPGLNATFDGSVIRQYADIHLGFATDTPRGLMVPVIRNAQRLSLRELSAEASRLSRACREGGVNPDELSGGTFTVTNLGALGVERFTPVLNVPQVAILGVCAIRPLAVSTAGSTVTFVPHIGLSLTINHQVIDGAPGARFLQALAQAIASLPALLAH